MEAGDYIGYTINGEFNYIIMLNIFRVIKCQLRVKN